ncbi:paraquat-inducible protein A [Polynucleobacter sphagniphilus]|nr:paraquat-inducible protein A [Polynucleobacter sphagniphilus]
MQLEKLLVCNQCDLMHQKPILEAGATAYCSRCANILYRFKPFGLRKSLAYALTAASLFLISNLFPIVTISTQGLINSATLLKAIHTLIQDDMWIIAILVFITTFLMPALEIGALIYLLLPLTMGRILPGASIAFRLLCLVKYWVMVEVFIMGLLVTITKLTAFASVKPDIALGSFALLMLFITAAVSNFDSRVFWSEMEKLQGNQADSI